MRRFVFAVRRFRWSVRLGWCRQAGRPEGHLDLSPQAAYAAAVGLFDLACAAEKKNLSVDLGRHLPCLANLILPPAEVWVLANDLFCCACRTLVKGSARIGYTTPVAVSGTDGDAPVVRWAGDPSDYPPPSAKDLADLDRGD